MLTFSLCSDPHMIQMMGHSATSVKNPYIVFTGGEHGNPYQSHTLISCHFKVRSDDVQSYMDVQHAVDPMLGFMASLQLVFWFCSPIFQALTIMFLTTDEGNCSKSTVNSDGSGTHLHSLHLNI